MVFWSLSCVQLDSGFIFAAGFAGVVVEMNGVISNLFALSRSIRQDCPLLLMLYILALEPFLCKLRVDPIVHIFTLSDASLAATHSEYAEDTSVLVMSCAEGVLVSKEIGKYEVVTRAKINCKKSEGLRLGSWTPSARQTCVR